MKLRVIMVVSLLMIVAGRDSGLAQQSASRDSSNLVWIAEMQGEVEIQIRGAGNWKSPATNQVLQPFDRIHTGPNSRMALRWSDQSVIPFGPSTELEILPPDAPDSENGLHVVRGIISFFHRDEPGRIRIVTRGAVAGVEGTEFVLSVDDLERTTLSVVDGVVRFGNESASLLLTNGQQAIVDPGQAPVRTAGFIANNLLQWCFYYPAVIDPDELQLTTNERVELAYSLADYRSGDLPGALRKYPGERTSISDNEKVYKAALYLSVGEVASAGSALSEITAEQGRPYQLSLALRQLIAAVKRQPAAASNALVTASECLAQSYFEQSLAVRTTSLENALWFAKQATALDPNFGFAWARVAELELSFGRRREALDALEHSLASAPNNAQAIAMKGFILMGQGDVKKAQKWFDRAIATDSALGNAWLGRGLVRMRRGDKIGGREDLLIAAALEPQRAELRSYLGKAYYYTGDDTQAMDELNLAGKLDPNDPTPWLYSALINQQNNRVNDAIRDLEKSKTLNDNRSVFRSGLLLDQDQAVRSADLAAIYKDAGMRDVSVREAARAVNADYANYSAHSFLAQSYTSQREGVQNNARYEPATISEFLLANLLSPASAGTMTPGLSQQGHFRPFEGNHLGVISSTEYLSRGAWAESGLQYGIFEKFSYDFQARYVSDPGQYANNDNEERSLGLKLKWQLTPDDGIYAQINQYQGESGSLFQYYDPETAGQGRNEEEQTPALTLGYHHEWSPGIHTLLLASLVDDDYTFNGRVPIITTFRFPLYTPDPNELIAVNGGQSLRSAYGNDVKLYTGELQQIFEQDVHTTIVGGRFQYADNHTTNLEDQPSAAAGFGPPGTVIYQDLDSSSTRFSLYAYHQWQIWDQLQLIGGLSYDWMEFPENLVSVPVSDESESIDQLSPKAGFIWEPAKDTTVRFAYTRSLGGQNFDQSVRIEPVQVAGFLQTFRSVVGAPSVAHTGANSIETFGLSLEQNLEWGTYLALTGELLNSQAQQTVGSLDRLWILPSATASKLRQSLDYTESSLQFTANQLVGRDWAFGVQYRLTHAKLNVDFNDIPDNIAMVDFQSHSELEAFLNNVDLYATFNHPSGFFASVDGRWYAQSNVGYSPDQPGDNFWQFDALAGYRFRHRTAELTVGVLNIFDQDYQLNPLTAYADLPRERTLMMRLKLNF